MKDIARIAEVSQSTVSRVLSGAGPSVRISEATRERVIAVAREHGFRPNPLARGLRGSRTMLLGVIVGDITDPFFPGMIEAIGVEARSRGYNMVLGHAQGKSREAVELHSVLETRHCDAIILAGDLSYQAKVLRELDESRVPTVSLARGSRGDDGMTAVDVDDHFGIQLVMDHLTRLGHERIAYVGARAYGDFPARRAAYLDYMRFRHLRVRRGYDIQTANNAASGAAAIEAMVRLPVPPTAVVAATDIIAIGILNGAFRARVDVPTQLSVTGFDDLAVAGYTVPPLTTIRMPIGQMAAAAVSAAIALAGSAAGEVAPATHIFRPELVIRESSAPPNPADTSSTSHMEEP